MGFKPPFEIGEVISNNQLSEAFQVGNMGGMRRSKRTGTLVLISDNTKGLYRDAWHNGVLQYTGMGKTGDQDLKAKQNKTLAESHTNGVEVHLFEVEKPGQYTYSGVVELAGAPYPGRQPDENGNDRQVWIFPLKKKTEESTEDKGMVFNATQGEGRIIKITEDKIYVDFGGGMRIFRYPDAFNKKYLVYLNEQKKTNAEDNPEEDQNTSNKGLRKKYWEYVLPELQRSFGNNGPYANVTASDTNTKDGFYGVRGIHLYSSIILRPKKCVAGLWIYRGTSKEDIAKTKAIFDLLYEQKETIESKIPSTIIWDRKYRTNAAAISVELAEDYTNEENWEKIAAFHVDMTKTLTEVIYEPHKDEIARIISE